LAPANKRTVAHAVIPQHSDNVVEACSFVFCCELQLLPCVQKVSNGLDLVEVTHWYDSRLNGPVIPLLHLFHCRTSVESVRQKQRATELSECDGLHDCAVLNLKR